MDILAKELLLKTMVSCPLPDNQRNKVPVSVSIVGTEMEEPTNLLKVIYNKPRLVSHFFCFNIQDQKIMQFCGEKKQVYGLQQGSHFSNIGYQF